MVVGWRGGGWLAEVSCEARLLWILGEPEPEPEPGKPEPERFGVVTLGSERSKTTLAQDMYLYHRQYCSVIWKASTM